VPAKSAYDCRTVPNLYASAPFLDAVAKIYFPTRRCAVEDFNLDGKAFRLLTVDGRPLVDLQAFLDMNEPLSAAPQDPRLRRLRGLAAVSHGIVAVDEFRNAACWSTFEGAPTIIWRGFKDWDEYLDLLRSRRVLAEDQRRRRRLQEVVGELEFTSDDLRDDVLPTCFCWKSARDRELNRIDRFAQEQTRDFFRELRARGLLRASSLRGDGRLLAIWLGAVFQLRWSGWVFAFDSDASLSKYSLGRQLLYPMLEESFRAGQSEFDFSIGFEPYKLFFATHARAIGYLGMPPVGKRIRRFARDLLKNQPWLYEKARTLRSRL